MANCGVLYIATGEQYIREAVQSALSLEKNTSGYPTKLVANKNPPDGIFDSIQIVESQEGFEDKIRHLRQTPYDRTVFLDSDTYVCGQIADLFELLEHYPLAAAHAPGRRPVSQEAVPKCFPEFNTGVLCYRSSDSVYNIFTQWLNEYEQERLTSLNDQPAFRRTLYGTDIKMATLPSEYNCRTIWPGYVDGPVRILHGRHHDPSTIAEKLNKSTEMRVFVPIDDDILIFTRNVPSLFKRAVQYYRQDGFYETIRRTIYYLKNSWNKRKF